MVTFNKHTTLVVWIFFLTKLNGRQRDKFFQSHGTLRVNLLWAKILKTGVYEKIIWQTKEDPEMINWSNEASLTQIDTYIFLQILPQIFKQLFTFHVKYF